MLLAFLIKHVDNCGLQENDLRRIGVSAVPVLVCIHMTAHCVLLFDWLVWDGQFWFWFSVHILSVQLGMVLLLAFLAHLH